MSKVHPINTALDDEDYKLLNDLKAEWRLRSYAEVISKLLDPHRKKH
jgi:hypothetical protein